VHVPTAQLVPPQQGCPGPPQGQVPFVQVAPFVHAIPVVQHACSSPPHAPQTPPEQFSLPIHVVPPQHAVPDVPHWHVPLLQVSLALQVLFPLPSRQQGCPVPPHATQVSLLLHTLPVLQAPPVQQGSPAAPQLTHWSDVEEQTPVWQPLNPSMLSTQHACPGFAPGGLPHWHWFPLAVPSPVTQVSWTLHVLSSQQG
jgi:hypothetical protein